jgi:glycerate kinase
MKIIIAPDSYKGSLTAVEVCDVIEEAILSVMPQAEIKKIPISDGGEGLVGLLVQANNGKLIKKRVRDPLLREIDAEYGIVKDNVAVIEMAAASGLPLLKRDERNPLLTSTFGTGELIRDAVTAQGCRKIILGIGGSATNDGGMGMAAALGFQFYDHQDQPLTPNGENLSRIGWIDGSQVDAVFSDVAFTIACDVDNPLCGSRGAAWIYAPQKGATEAMVTRLDQGLHHFGRLLEQQSGKALIDQPGMGAAGGLALPLVALMEARLQSGLEIVLDDINFDEAIEGADLILTGEGKTDHQSAMGKVVWGIGRRGKKQNIPVIVISGALEAGYESLYDHGVTAAFATYSGDQSLDWHMVHAGELLYDSVVNLFRMLKARTS